LNKTKAKLNKKKFFIFIIFFTFSLVILLLEIISKKFILYNYGNKYSVRSNDIYKKYYTNVNHLRNPFEFTYDELIFTKIFSKNDKTSTSNVEILFQGDSWSEQFISFKGSKDLITNFALNNNVNFYLAGTSSYSPSIYQAQLTMLIKNFNLDPKIIVVGIDQTDIGDELCRYKNNRSYINDEIVVTPFKVPSDGFLYNMENTFKRLDYLNSDKLSFIKLFLVSTLKIQEHYSIYKFGHKCNILDIVNPLYGKITEDEIKYFSKVVSEYIEKVFSLNNISNLIIITHPHRDHVLKKYKIDIKDIIQDTVSKNKNKEKIFILNFNDELNLVLEKNSIATIFPINDPMHVAEHYHQNIYTKKILEIIKNNFLK
jgi:hypothetical protein